MHVEQSVEASRFDQLSVPARRLGIGFKDEHACQRAGAAIQRRVKRELSIRGQPEIAGNARPSGSTPLKVTVAIS
jgi:hypothetical protein